MTTLPYVTCVAFIRPLLITLFLLCYVVSLPYMLIPDSYDVQPSPSGNGRVLPLTAHRVRCMSFGFVAPSSAGGKSKEAVMRGPMASKVSRGDLSAALTPSTQPSLYICYRCSTSCCCPRNGESWTS